MTVLVVDDSAVVRRTMTAILSATPDMEVMVAADPLIAMRRMAETRPDVLLLDLELPHMHGLTFLRRIMAEDPIPVVICSGLAGRRADIAIRALEEGAVEVVAKPEIGVRDFLSESAVRLVDAVRAAAQARLRPASGTVGDLSRRPERPSGPTGYRGVVVIGASTGGPEALRTVLPRMPEDAPGFVIVQHMPARFTPAFARHLDELCRIDVREARDGDRVVPGRALIAPGNRHVKLCREASDYAVEVYEGRLVSRHRPSADVLFRSAAAIAGAEAVGVILSGMGDDGAAGLAALRRSGATTLAQDRSSCVVYGMPKVANDRGAVDRVVGLDTLVGAILKAARSTVDRSG
ncbi:MAG: protein-glutamate methylesterase/protein-glutamine glutaminase [Gemmatimonadota bacterium]